MNKARLLRVVPAAAFGAGLVVALAGPVSASIPPGDNGTVKVDGELFDTDPDNEPHVDCEFQIDFYGFDEGEDLFADVLFEAISPTPEGPDPVELLSDSVFIGEDSNEGGGTDLDAEEPYDLSSALANIEPQPEQGWHVKLTIHADGSIGDDTKYKVFWVTGCQTPPTTTPEETPTTAPEETTTTAPGETTTTAPGVSPTTPTTTPGGELPRTGSNTAPMVVGALSLLALGTAGVYGSKHLRKARSS